MKKLLLVTILLLILVWVSTLFINKPTSQTEAPLPQTPAETEIINTEIPLHNALTRITKKSFGTYITPENSPVSPEKFRGWHTGTDFEILPGEENTDITFYAICDGNILQKRSASGYGGLLIQACTINAIDVTVIYGHVNITSIAKNVGDPLTQSETIGILGQVGVETDNERQHLHLGIHKGMGINILGYVQNQSQLEDWLDFSSIQF